MALLRLWQTFRCTGFFVQQRPGSKSTLQKHFKLLLCVIFKQEWAVSAYFVCRGHCKLCTMFVKTSSGRHCISARYCSFGFKVLVSLVFLCFFLNPLGAKCDFRFVGH